MNEKHQAMLEQQLQLLSERSKAEPSELVVLTGAMIQVVSELENANFVLTQTIDGEGGQQ